MKALLFSLPLAFAAAIASSQSLEYVEANRQIMLDAARALAWPDPLPGFEENRAYLLIKTQTIRAPVGIIFGYHDNADACWELARDLSAAANARGFGNVQDLYVCDVVY